VIEDGTRVLDDLARSSRFGSLEALLAAHTLFLHPDVVKQTRGRAVVPVVRDFARRGTAGQLPDGRRVVFCDNSTPRDLFLWSSGSKTARDVQYNHVWPGTNTDPDAYTALWNLCVTPAFLARLTDRGALMALVQYRAFTLFGDVLPMKWRPNEKPEGYDSLEEWWLGPAGAVKDLEAALRSRMARRPRSRASLAASHICWLFHPDGPDETLGLGWVGTPSSTRGAVRDA